MANADLGEIAFGETHTLLLDYNAFAEAEDQLGMTIPALLSGGEKTLGFKAARILILVGLAHHHPNLTLQDVGGLIQNIGLPKAITLIAAAAKASFPEASAEGKVKPPPARRVDRR